jgi:hypothetical protein
VCFPSCWWLLQFLNSYDFGEARLQCEPSGLKLLSNWMTCPAMQCEGEGNPYIGNVTSSGCTQTTCAYTGYDNQTIFTSLVTDSTCPGWGNLQEKIGVNNLFIFFHKLINRSTIRFVRFTINLCEIHKSNIDLEDEKWRKYWRQSFLFSVFTQMHIDSLEHLQQSLQILFFKITKNTFFIILTTHLFRAPISTLLL